jgi:pullulanase/glycogen debranching enzyme
VVRIRVPAPRAVGVTVVEFDRSGSERGRVPMDRRADGTFSADVPEGTLYGLVAEGDGPRFDPSKVLLDPWATEVWFPPGHDRELATRFGVDNAGRGPLAVANPPRPARPQRRSSRGPVVYEAHVRGMTATREDADAPGTFGALTDELPRLQRLGVTVIELLPVHQNDPQEGSYWGYMPLAFGAVHRRYAVDDPAEELARFVAAAHDHDMEVWLDVVFNHTTEVDPTTGPTYSQRGLDDASFYRLREDGSYIETTGCGQRHRRHVAGGPAPRALGARPVGRPRRRRLPLRPRRGARPRPRLRRRAHAVGRRAWRRARGRALGRRRRPPPGPGLAGRRVAALERRLP